MSRKFKTPDYEATLNQTISMREALPPNHLARLWWTSSANSI
jgi:hypothetical protein